MSFDDFKRTNLNYVKTENRFQALNLPYIAASNFYTAGNVQCSSINNIPIGSFGGNVDIENVGNGVDVYQGQTGDGPFRFRSLAAGTGVSIALSGDDNEVDIGVNTGSTAGTVAAGNDARFSTENVLRVKKNPGAGEYSSIAAACAAITDSNDANPYLIYVGAGIYTEPQITAPAYVSIYGMSMSEVIVEPAGNHDVFVMLSPGDISFLSVRNVPAGRFAFNINNPGDYALLHKVSIYDSAGGFNIDCDVFSRIYLEYVDVSGASEAPFVINISSVEQSLIIMENTYYIAGIATNNPNTTLEVNGNTDLHITACGFFGSTTGNDNTAIKISNGANLELLSAFVNNYELAISAPSGSAGSNIILSSLSMVACDRDIDIQNPDTTGFFNGTVDYPKISINTASEFYLANRGYENILVSTRGGDFTSVKAAMDSITDAGPTRPYTITVDPGVYTEDTITAKPYVSVIGSGYAVTHIKTRLASQSLFLSSGQFNLYNCDASCGTDVGCAIIRSSGGLGVDRALSVRTLGGYHFIRSVSSSIGVAFGIYNCLGSSTTNCDTMFYFEDGGMGLITTVIINGFQAIGAQPWTSWLYASGTGVEVVVNNSLVNKLNGIGTGVYVADGAIFRSMSLNVRGFDIGFHTPNIGSAPALRLNSFVSRINTTWDVLVEHPGTAATIFGVAREANTSINPAVTDVSVNITKIDTDDPGIITLGGIKVGPKYNELVNLVDVVQSNTVGLLSGGTITVATGLNVNVAAGRGLVFTTTNYFREIDFNAATITLPDNVASYVFVNENGIISSNTARPDNVENLILGRVYTNSGAIQFIDLVPFEANQFGNYLDNYNRDVYGGVFQQGSIASVNGSFQLTVTGGIYYLSGLQITPSGIAAGATFKQYWSNAAGSWDISDVVAVNNTQYNRLTDFTLQSLTAGFYTKHSIYLVGQGAYEQYFLVIGQDEYATQLEAEDSVNVAPSFFIDGVVAVAEVVIQQGALAPISVLDVRPRPAFAAAIPTGTPTAHASLSGLTIGNDHPQYMLRAGTLPMTGNLSLGGNNITNTGTVNGVVVETHASRHLPNGADPLTTAAPVSVGVANAVGVANSFARSDHVHDHGAQTSPTLHAVATSGANGFMSSGDKTKLDASTALATAGTLVQRDGSGLIQVVGLTSTTGGALTLNNAADTFATTISTATGLAQNTTFTLPANNGSASQALITDGSGITSWGAATPATHAATHLPNGSDPLTTATAVTVGVANAVGVANSFARSDHVHDHGAQTSPTLHAVATGGANGFMSSVDKTKLDASTSLATAETLVQRGVNGEIDVAEHIRIYNVGGTFATTIGVDSGLAQNTTFTLPVTNGVANQALITNGSGVTSWGAATPTTHASTHLPNGADPLTTAAPVTVGTTNAIGTANSFARSDHVHDHGAQTSPTLHAVATGGANGFMSSADKTKLDAATAASTNSTLVLRNGAGNAAFKGLDIDAAGGIVLHNIDNTFSATISTPTLTQNTAFTLPANNGTASQALITDGNGVTSWGAATPAAHASTHLPNGSDPLTTAAPVSVGVANAIGVANSFARSDHVHDHGAQTSPTLHAVATSGANGFMSSGDKTKLDASTPLSSANTLVSRNASGITAVRGLNVDAAGSIVLNNIDNTFSATISTPTLAQNTAFTLPSTNGSASQALITNGSGITSWGAATPVAHASTHLPNGSDPLTTAAPVSVGTANAVGTANSFARSDHVHNHGAQTDPTLHAVATSGANGFMSSADKTKLDASTSLNTSSAIVQRDVSGNVACSNYITGNNGQVRLYNSGGTFYTALASNTGITQTYLYRFPSTYGTEGQFLRTDGAGNMSWANNNKIYIPITSIVNSSNNYVTRLGAASALSGVTTGITITAGTATTSDYITYTGSIGVATCKMSVQFANNNNTWRNWSLNLSVVGTSVTGNKSASKMVPASATNWRDNADIDVGGVDASGQISASITWGDTRVITLLNGYIIVYV
ncbi:cell wall anchor protein [Faustovirus]|nr:cell wall anchor protein [Faustovirus]